MDTHLRLSPTKTFFMKVKRKTKIICTIGPSSENIVEDLVKAGMDIARINTAYTKKTNLSYKKPLMIDVRTVERLKDIYVPKKSYVALSFVKTSKCIISAREYVSNELIAKIETKEAIRNLKEIIRLSDMIMIARGDLGKEFGIHNIPVLQDKIIRLCQEWKKPFIVATELLKSMTCNHYPTRAEAIDIMYAVKSGAFGLMLAEETAIGKYPIEAVKWMNKIITTVERTI